MHESKKWNIICNWILLKIKTLSENAIKKIKWQVTDEKNIFAEYKCYKELGFRLYKEILQLNNKRQPNKRCTNASQMNESGKVTQHHPLITKKMQIKTIMLYYYTPMRKLKLKTSDG